MKQFGIKKLLVGSTPTDTAAAFVLAHLGNKSAHELFNEDKFQSARLEARSGRLAACTKEICTATGWPMRDAMLAAKIMQGLDESAYK